MGDLTKKELSLAKTYRRMATEEIEMRLAAGDLAPMAASMAGEELRRRKDEGEMDEETPWLLLALYAIQAIVAIGFVLIVDEDMLLLVVAVELPILGALIGKAFPRFGFIFGCLLVPFPIYVIALIWMSWSKESLPWLLWIFLAGFSLVISAIISAVGVMMILGARHLGDWNNFFDWLKERRSAAAAKVKWSKR